MLESAAVSTEQPGDPSTPQRAMDGFLTDFARQNPDLAWFAQLVAMQRQAAAQVQSEPPELEAARAPAGGRAGRRAGTPVRSRRNTRRLWSVLGRGPRLPQLPWSRQTGNVCP